MPGVEQRAPREHRQSGWLRSPWFAFAVLALGFELPMLLAPDPFRPSGDPLVLALLWLAGARIRHGRALRVLAVVLGVTLLLHRIDRVAFQRFLGDEPLLYDQLFLVRHLLVLISDLWGLRNALLLLAIAACIAAAARATRWLLARLVLPQASAELRGWYAAGALVCAIALPGSFLPSAGAPLVRWQAAEFAADLKRSSRIYAGVDRLSGASPYRGYGALSLERRPDVYLILVESYGRMMADRAALRRAWSGRLRRMERRLRGAGWHAASAFSTAPVLGGRSWLAEATLLLGAPVAYQAVFYHLMGRIERVPHLVRFLDGVGYHSVLLAPADRDRPGVRNVNHYGYDRIVRFLDLHYRGPKMGWGLVPDQYSLGYTHEHVLQRAPRPLFFNFHMVSSHAPWEQVPELVADWHTLNDGSMRDEEQIRRGSPYTALKRFVRSTRDFARFAERGGRVQRYGAAIRYELALIERYLSELPGDALVIALGDHQPPFVGGHSRDYDTPVHVFARDPKLLEELRARGFTDGLVLGASQRPALTHAGFFSLLVRVLAGCCGVQGQKAPAFLRDGIVLGG